MEGSTYWVIYTIAVFCVVMSAIGIIAFVAITTERDHERKQ